MAKIAGFQGASGGTLNRTMKLTSNLSSIMILLLSLVINFPLLASAFSFATQEKSHYGKDFYDKMKGGMRDEELITELQSETSKFHRVLGYNRARTVMMGQIYLDQQNGDYKIQDVYCLKDFTNSDFNDGKGLGPHRIPDNTVLNTEHTWPQSRFSGRFSRDMQKSDLHHLFPSDTQMNSSRGNFKFGEVRSTERLKCDTARLGRDGKEFRFEPPQSHKGNVARALFYFSVRYSIHIDQDEEAFLKKWHKEDPVDQAEITHHEGVYQAQGNRNPFIDHPELVEEIGDF